MHAEHDIVTANLSVRLSVTRWYRIETNADIVQLFPPPGMSMILVFFRGLPPLQNSYGNLLGGCVK